MTSFIEKSQPEAEEREQNTLVKTYPCDHSTRARIIASLNDELSASELARRSGVNKSIVVQYLNPAGNTYTGSIAVYEKKLAGYLDRRDLGLMSGIETIQTAIIAQMEAAARAVQQCHIMGSIIGEAGVGKTRGCFWLHQKDPTSLLILASREQGTREAVRRCLFKEAGIRGPQKQTRYRRLDMMQQLIAALRGTERLIIVDQAHKLSGQAIDFLVELFNATGSPFFFAGTDEWLEKLSRDAQWSSRIDFRDRIEIQSEEVRPIVQHQIKSRITEINGEMNRLTNLCEKLALVDGHFRRVEMRLNMMLYLVNKPTYRGKTWCDVFEGASQFLKNEGAEN